MTDARDAIDEVLDGAALLGAEIDTRYRVLAATVEPRADRHPEGPEVADGRLQLVLHPCSEVAARLVVDGSTVERFPVEQLLDVVHRFDEAPLAAPVLTADAGQLTGELSFDGAAGPAVMDGRRHAALFQVTRDGRTLTLRVTYDEAELRRPDGTPIAV